MCRFPFILAFLALATTLNAQTEMSDMEDGCAMSHDMAAEQGEHDHPALPVDAALPIPSLTHLVFPDAMDGYNVQILSRNFTFILGPDDLHENAALAEEIQSQHG